MDAPVPHGFSAFDIKEDDENGEGLTRTAMLRRRRPALVRDEADVDETLPRAEAVGSVRWVCSAVVFLRQTRPLPEALLHGRVGTAVGTAR